MVPAIVLNTVVFTTSDTCLSIMHITFNLLKHHPRGSGLNMLVASTAAYMVRYHSRWDAILVTGPYSIFGANQKSRIIAFFDTKIIGV